MNTDTIDHGDFAHLEDDWDSASRYVSIFIDECEETLDELTQALLALEAGEGHEGIEQLFVGAHRIKGSAASIGLNRPAKLAHLMEDLLQVLVDEGRTLEPKTADGLLACTDGLREYVQAMARAGLRMTGSTCWLSNFLTLNMRAAFPSSHRGRPCMRWRVLPMGQMPHTPNARRSMRLHVWRPVLLRCTSTRACNDR